MCASCGKAAVDDVKLKKCACDIVKYCSVDCQKNHRPQHKKACKKQLAQIRDDELFTQNEISHLGECPICCLPLPLGQGKSKMNACCSQRICLGCAHANEKREVEQGLEPRCAYCREVVPITDEDIESNSKKRFKANDPVAITEMGFKCYDEGDFDGAVEYWTRAAGLGHETAHYNLSMLYTKGEGVDRNKKKAMYHLEEAAIRGHPNARYGLAYAEELNGMTERAMRHYIIAAKLGDDGALEAVKKGYQGGDVSKEDFEAALRGHQAAVDATKSELREEAYAWFKQNADQLRF